MVKCLLEIFVLTLFAGVGGRYMNAQTTAAVDNLNYTFSTDGSNIATFTGSTTVTAIANAAFSLMTPTARYSLR